MINERLENLKFIKKDKKNKNSITSNAAKKAGLEKPIIIVDIKKITQKIAK
ncbi:MAG: hypothetical protein M1479_00140 [Actinobacteria bacterium]|nr:hypothetical protein [Actinomycetota bacterium]